MKKTIRSSVRNVISIGIVTLLALILWSCNNSGNNENKVKNTTTEKPTFQPPDDLLAGIHKAICYSGFREGQHPDRGNGANNPTDVQIIEDLKIIADEMDIHLIRLYDCGENSQAVLRIIDTENFNIKVMLGVWLKAELSAHETCSWLTEPIPQQELNANKKANLLELQRGIDLANKYKDIIVAVNVGNEALVEWNDHMMDVDTVIRYCQTVKSHIAQPVTVADNYDWWAREGLDLANALDFISIHVYPVWEGKDIDEALPYSIENIMKVREAIPNAPIVISEAGWASQASEFGKRASEEKQAAYYHQIMDWTKQNNITTFIFEAFDEPWKGNPDNAYGAEKHWGLYFENRTPKKIFQN